MSDANIESLYDSAVKFVYSRSMFDEQLIKKILQVDGDVLRELIDKMIENGVMSEADSDGNYTPSSSYIHSDYLLRRELARDNEVAKEKKEVKTHSLYLKILPIIAFFVFLLTCYFASREMITLLFIVPSCLLCLWLGEKLKGGVVIVSFLIIITCTISLIYVNSLTPIFGDEYAERANNQKALNAAKEDEHAADRDRIIAMDNAMNSVKLSLKDPDSAKFSSSNLGRSGAVCGWVNAKNSFGSYSGDSRYISIGGKSIIDDGNQEFSDSWSHLCN